ncbi:MAG: hypothetical protein LBQ65_02000 [Tannerellaceae bacterium]|jgi:hypothetical protein|nr:hypothetical protein [Tannerellaceae bacterium]
MKKDDEKERRESCEEWGCKTVLRTLENGRAYAFLALSAAAELIKQIEASPAHRDLLYSSVHVLDISGNVSKALCLLSELLPEQMARIRQAVENNKHLFDAHYFDRYPDEIED